MSSESCRIQGQRNPRGCFRAPTYPHYRLREPCGRRGARPVGGACGAAAGPEPQFAAARTPQERTVLRAQVNAYDRQIDQQVYELYELTEVEIAVVEGA